MRISDWSSDVCSSDLPPGQQARYRGQGPQAPRSRPLTSSAAGRDCPAVPLRMRKTMADARHILLATMQDLMSNYLVDECPDHVTWEDFDPDIDGLRSTVIDLLDKRSEEHTSELQSLM